MTTIVIVDVMIYDDFSDHDHYYHDDNVLCRWIDSDSSVSDHDHRALVAIPNDSDDVWYYYCFPNVLLLHRHGHPVLLFSDSLDHDLAVAMGDFYSVLGGFYFFQLDLGIDPCRRARGGYHHAVEVDPLRDGTYH